MVAGAKAKWMQGVGLACGLHGLLAFATPGWAQSAPEPNMSGPPPDMSVLKRDKKWLSEPMIDKTLLGHAVQPSIVFDTHEQFRPANGLAATRPLPNPTYSADAEK